MNIFIVTNNYEFRDALKLYLNQVLRHTVVGEAKNGIEFLEKYRYNSDIVLMDIKLPNMDGYETIQRAVYKDRRIKAIAMTTPRENPRLARLISTGFKGCLLKTEILNKVSEALYDVNKGGLHFPEEISIM